MQPNSRPVNVWRHGSATN